MASVRPTLIITFSLCVCFSAPTTFAFTWQDLWSTPNQQGAKALKKKQAKKAAKLFSAKNWKGVANYRAKSYQQAVRDFAKNKSPQANYNRGNALAKAGQYQVAIDAYNQRKEWIFSTFVW